MSTDALIPKVQVPLDVIGPDRAHFDGARVNGCLAGDLVLRKGRVAGMQPGETGGPIVLPALTEAHVHLDKCHSIDRLGDVGGDLADALAAQAADKVNWTAEDLETRARRGLYELVEAGCALARTHVDWGVGAEPPLAWDIATGLAKSERHRIDLDVAALTSVTDLADSDLADQIARRIAKDGGTLGAFVLNHETRREGIENAFRMADRFGLALDFHVDEGMMPGLDGVETIADIAIATGFEGPVLCGHAVGLMTIDGANLTRVIDKVAAAGLAVVTLPTTNLYLQGRQIGTPNRRGLTRIHELTAAGVPVAIGCDNVRDAFCPVGWHDPMAALHLAILAGHLDPPFGRYLRMITTTPAAGLGRKPIWVGGASITDLRISTARTLPDLIAGQSGPPRPFDPLKEVQT